MRPLALLPLLGELILLGFASDGMAARWFDPRLDFVPWSLDSPIVKLSNGGLMGIDYNGNAVISFDDGAHFSQWSTGPMYSGPGPGIPSYEGQLVQGIDGTLVYIYQDLSTANFDWIFSSPPGEAGPNINLDVWTIRSTDGGKTWSNRQKIYDGWNGALTSVVRTSEDKIVVPVMEVASNPGRNVIAAYTTADNGLTWTRGGVIDLAEGGHHGGALEPTLFEINNPLHPGELKMYIRTNFDEFYVTTSDDDGQSWSTSQPSGINASSSHGFVTRLSSGRLALVWNQVYPEGLTPAEQAAWPRLGGPGSFTSETPASWHREEVSIAFSEDEGATWSTPQVIIQEPDSWLSYPYLFEKAPGELWLQTWFNWTFPNGDAPTGQMVPAATITVKLDEADFFPTDNFAWEMDVAGDWASGANWGRLDFPNTNEHSAVFGDSIHSSRTVRIDSPVTVNSLTFDNANTYAISGTNTLTLAAKSDSTLPTVNVLQGAHQIQSRVVLSASTTVAAGGGSLDFNNQIDLGGFTLTTSGNVNINHSTVNGGSVMNLGALGTGGSTSISGNLTNSGSLEIDLGPANTDFFNVSGLGTLGGTLNVQLEPGFSPSGSFTVLTAAGGIIDQGIMLTGAGGFTKSIVDGPGSTQSLVLSMSIGLTGDYNGDGTVDAADYVVWRKTGINGQQGFTDWRTNFGFGNTSGSGAGLAGVPEPTALTFLISVCCSPAFFTRPRRRISRARRTWRARLIALCVAMSALAVSRNIYAAISVIQSTNLFAGSIEARPGATLLKWDQGLNTDTTGPGEGWPGVLKASPYAGESNYFLNQGVLLEDSSGFVDISDLTSATITEDVRVNAGQTVTIRFMEPGNASAPAAVSAVGIRMGGTANPLNFGFYDVNNALINNLSVAGGLLRDPAFIAMDGGVEVAAIHRIDVSFSGGGFHVLGTLNDSPAKLDLSLFPTPQPVTNTFTWNVDAGGDWTTALNWGLGGFPNGPGHAAIFGDAISSPRTVSVDTSVTVNSLTLDNPNSYAISGTGTITLADRSDGVLPLLTVGQGAHRVQAKISLASDTTVDATSGELDFNNVIQTNGNDLSLHGTVNINHSISGGGTVTNRGMLGVAGLRVIDGNFSSDGTLAIDLGGTNPGSYDSFRVTGSVDIRGRIEIALDSGFVPADGDTFTILSSSGPITFGSLPIYGPLRTGDNQGFSLLTDRDGSSLLLVYHLEVPEPHSALLIVAGLACLWRFNPRRR